MSDILMCPCCYKVYRKELVDLSWNRCPDIECDSCDAEMFEIDELMIEPIRILNKKGYTTRFCCSGHVYESFKSSYISFHHLIDLNSAPVGWVLEKGEFDAIRLNNSTLFNNVDYNNPINWCKSLPESDY